MILTPGNQEVMEDRSEGTVKLQMINVGSEWW